MKARKLKDISVSYISLVTKGANKKTIIWKSNKDADKEETEKIQNIKFAKTDEEKHMVYGIVYAPDQLDSDGDYADAKEIEKAAHRFMRNGIAGYSVDKQHDYNPSYGYVAESWIVKKKDSLFPDEIGAWAVGIKVEDDNTWEEIKKGEISGLSMAGNAHFEMQETELNKFIKMFKNLLGIEKTQKDGEEMTEKEVKDLVSTTVDEKIKAVEKSVSDKIDAISKTVNDGFEKIQKSISEKPEEKPEGETKSETEAETQTTGTVEKTENQSDESESVTDRLTTLEKNMEKLTGIFEGMSNAIISKSDVSLEKGDNETDIFSNVVNV